MARQARGDGERHGRKEGDRVGPACRGERETDRWGRFVRGKARRLGCAVRERGGKGLVGFGPWGAGFPFVFVLPYLFLFCFIHNFSFNYPNDLKQICKFILFDVLSNHTISK